MSFEIRGADELAGYLKKMATMDDVKQAVKINTSEMQNQAMRRAPVDTGNLKRMIEIDFSDGGLTGKVTSSAGYSGYLEWGTRFMSAQPYMRPSFKVVGGQFDRDMSRLMDKR